MELKDANEDYNLKWEILCRAKTESKITKGVASKNTKLKE